MKTIFGVPIEKVVVDVYPHAQLRVTGMGLRKEIVERLILLAVEHLVRDLLILSFELGGKSRFEENCNYFLRYVVKSVCIMRSAEHDETLQQVYKHWYWRAASHQVEWNLHFARSKD